MFCEWNTCLLSEKVLNLLKCSNKIILFKKFLVKLFTNKETKIACDGKGMRELNLNIFGYFL